MEYKGSLGKTWDKIGSDLIFRNGMWVCVERERGICGAFDDWRGTHRIKQKKDIESDKQE